MEIVNRNLSDITDAMHEYAYEKLDFSEFGVKDMKLVVSSVANEIFIKAKFTDDHNHHYNLSVNRQDYYEAIDILKDIVFAALTKRRQKLVARRDGGLDMQEDPHIVREKLLIASQMSTARAIAEMEDLGHDFFVFRNEDDDIAILYDRHDGDLGVMIVR